MIFTKEDGWHFTKDEDFPEITERSDDPWKWSSSDEIEFVLSNGTVKEGAFHTWPHRNSKDSGMCWEANGDPKTYREVVAWRYL